MGAFWSVIGNRGSDRISNCIDVSSGESCKRQRMTSIYYEGNARLIPSLPDEISIQVLARLPRVCYFNTRRVARNWKAAVMSPELFDLRKELGFTEEWLYLLIKIEGDELMWHAFDPCSNRWQRLPPIPNVVYEEETRKGLLGLLTWNMLEANNNIANLIRGWIGQKDPSAKLPFCGCAIGAVDGCLYVLGGFSRSSATRCVWRYDPILNNWKQVAPMSIGRAHCKTGILNNKLYVVGGVSRVNSGGGLSPLQSAEVFDPCTGTWSQVPSMPFSKAQAFPTPFLAGMLKPIATGMATYNGKLCVAQSLYSWPFFVEAGGEIYDPKTNSWEEMPFGMGDGWPARQAGSKPSVVVDEELYAFDPSDSLNSGKIKVYDTKEDAWKVVIEKVPKCNFAESESPYLLAGLHGKLHFVTKDSNHNIAILQADVRDSRRSFPSTSSTLVSCCLDEHIGSVEKVDTVIWKLITLRNFGSAELVDCQVLKV